MARGVASARDLGVHVHTDDFWHYIVAGAIPPYLPESDAQNHTVVEAIVGAAYAYVEGGYDVVVDGIVGPWMLDHYRRKAALHPAVALHYVVLRPSREVTLSRAQARTSADALGDAGPILSLWDQFSSLGVLESHVLDSTELSVERTEDTVRAGLDTGRYRII